jgi:hypothetical protein
MGVNLRFPLLEGPRRRGAVGVNSKDPSADVTNSVLAGMALGLLLAGVLGVLAILAPYYVAEQRSVGRMGLSRNGMWNVYGRVAPFADCSRRAGLPANERFLCPGARHPVTTQGYLWGKNSPIHGVPHSADGRIRDFALRVIRDKPLSYGHVIAADVAHYFEPGHRIGANDYSPAPWEFPSDPAKAVYPDFRGPIRPAEPQRGKLITPDRYVGAMGSSPRTNAGASRLLRLYQRFAYTSGQILAICLVVVLAALAVRRGASRLRLDAALLAAATLIALVVAAALSLFSYRYGLTAVILLPPAAALAGAALLESAFALCLGCRIFAVLMAWGLVPASVCEACADLGKARAGAARPS